MGRHLIQPSITRMCPKCGVETATERFAVHNRLGAAIGWCRQCHMTYGKEHARPRSYHYRYRYRHVSSEHSRAIKARHRARHPDRIYARNMITRLIGKGVISRQPCSTCGSPNAQAHHEDYSKPLDITWLCYDHHMAHHGRRAKRKGEAE